VLQVCERGFQANESVLEFIKELVSKVTKFSFSASQKGYMHYLYSNILIDYHQLFTADPKVTNLNEQSAALKASYEHLIKALNLDARNLSAIELRAFMNHIVGYHHLGNRDDEFLKHLQVQSAKSGNRERVPVNVGDLKFNSGTLLL
jgi:hypothetical protein